MDDETKNGTYVISFDCDPWSMTNTSMSPHKSKGDHNQLCMTSDHNVDPPSQNGQRNLVSSHTQCAHRISRCHMKIQIFCSSIDEIFYMALCKQCGIDHKNLTHFGLTTTDRAKLRLRWFYLRHWVAFAARIPSTIKRHKLTHDMAQP